MSPTPRTRPRCAKCPPKGELCIECYRIYRAKYKAERAAREGTSQAKLAKPAPRDEKVIRCPKCPPTGRRCEECVPLKPTGFHKTRRIVTQPRETVNRVITTERASDLVCCPGCMRKMRGGWRFCQRCEQKRQEKS